MDFWKLGPASLGDEHNPECPRTGPNTLLGFGERESVLFRRLQCGALFSRESVASLRAPCLGRDSKVQGRSRHLRTTRTLEA